MAIVINGSGTVTGLAVGGLPDGTVDAGTLATDSVVTGKIADGTIANADIADLAASKLTGALPAISAANLTGIPAPTTAQMPAGSVLQVVNTNYGTETSSTSATFADTGITLTITPTSANSKILVLVNITGCFSSVTNNYMVLKLVRNSQDLINIETQALYKAATAAATTSGTGATHLDAPSTTNATTYKVQYRNVSAQGYVMVCAGSAKSTITAMEIAV